MLICAGVAITEVPREVGGVRAEIGERDSERREAVGGFSGEVRDDGRIVRRGDVIGERERVCSAETDGGERDGEAACVGVGVKWMLVCAGVAITEVPREVGGVGTEISECDRERSETVGGFGGKVRDDRRVVGRGDVIGERERVCSAKTDGSERDGVAACVGVGVKRMLVGAGVAIAEIPRVTCRARGEIGKRHDKRPETVGRSSCEVRDDWWRWRVGDGDVGGADKCVCSSSTRCYERDVVRTRCRVNVRRIGGGACIAVTEIPCVICRARRKISECDDERRNAVGG